MSSALMRTDGHYRLYNKGAAEWVLKRCTHACDTDGKVQPLAPGQADELVGVITGMASRGLRCICLAYTDYEMDDASRCVRVCVDGWAGQGGRAVCFGSKIVWTTHACAGWLDQGWGACLCAVCCVVFWLGVVSKFMEGKEGGSGPYCTMLLQAFLHSSCTAEAGQNREMNLPKRR